MYKQTIVKTTSLRFYSFTSSLPNRLVESYFRLMSCRVKDKLIIGVICTLLNLLKKAIKVNLPTKTARFFFLRKGMYMHACNVR
jgi:hypothetical protein